MEFNAFANRCRRYLDSYFDALAGYARRGEFRDDTGARVTPSFPSMLLLSEMPTHFGAELVGASSEWAPLTVIERSLPGLENFLGFFPDENAWSPYRFEEGGGDNGISSIFIMAKRDIDAFQDRYPELEHKRSAGLIWLDELEPDRAFNALFIPDRFRDLWLTDFLTVSSWHEQVRARYFQAAWITERSASSSELQRRLVRRYPIGRDTQLLTPATTDEHLAAVTAANFSSLATIDRIGETTITKFLELNEPVLLRALGGARLIPQPLLPWIEGNPDEDEDAIQPDFLLVDSDNQVHICEVKLPLLERNTLTTGGHRRRRFRKEVSEGIAQLFNYEDYVLRPAHKALVNDRYGADVSEPRLILLIGTSENYDELEVTEAKRSHRTFELVDYDSLRALYLAASAQMPGAAQD